MLTRAIGINVRLLREKELEEIHLLVPAGHVDTQQHQIFTQAGFREFPVSHPTSLSDWFQKKQKPQLQSWLKICFHLKMSLVDILTIPRERSSNQSQVLENHADMKPSKKQLQRFSRERLQSFLEGVLKDDEGDPPSVREVARRLGCDRGTLYAMFPALARAITAKQRDYQRAIRQKQLSHQQIRLNKPRKQDQKPDWDMIQQALEAILADTESIPLPMKTIASQLGHFPRVLTRKFPDLCRAISARYAEDRRQRGEARKQELGQQVRQVMFSFHEQGRHPGILQVRKQLNDAWLCRDPYTKAIWRETLSELSVRNREV